MGSVGRLRGARGFGPRGARGVGEKLVNERYLAIPTGPICISLLTSVRPPVYGSRILNRRGGIVSVRTGGHPGVWGGSGRRSRLVRARVRVALLCGALLMVLATPAAASAESYREAVEGTSGLTHFWPMGESSGSTLADVKGSADAEVSSSGVTLGQAGGLPGESSTSVLFDGSAGAAHASVDLSGTHVVTVEFWMKWGSFASDDHLALELTPDFNEYSGGFLVDPDATPGSDFAVSIGKGGSRNTVFFARPSAGVWHYYAFVIDTEAGAEDEITPYVDGHVVSYTKSESGTGGRGTSRTPPCSGCRVTRAPCLARGACRISRCMTPRSAPKRSPLTTSWVPAARKRRSGPGRRSRQLGCRCVWTRRGPPRLAAPSPTTPGISTAPKATEPTRAAPPPRHTHSPLRAPIPSICA